jgi:hypothetical protein
MMISAFAVQTPTFASDREFELLVNCCRWPVSAAEHERISHQSATIDWSRFARLAGRHRVEGLVWPVLAAAAVEAPADIASILKDRAFRIARQNLLAAAECKRLRDAFASAGIDLLFIKGLTVAVLAYGSIMPKAASDVDVLIARNDLRRACNILRQLGYRALLPAAGSDTALTRWHAVSKESIWRGGDGSMLELHTSLADHSELIPSIGIGSPRQSVDVASDVHLDTLARDELFAYLCVHGASSAWFRLKWLADLAALLAECEQAETSRLYDRALDLGAGVPAAAALILAHRLFGITVAPERLGDWMRRPAIRVLVHASVKSMTGRRGEVELQQVPLGTIWIHLAQMGMIPSAKGKLSELRRQLLISKMSRQDGKTSLTPEKTASD